MAFFTFEMDELLVNNVKSRNAMTTRKWDRLAESFEGLTGAECKARWELLQTHSGIEYKALIGHAATPTVPPLGTTASVPPPAPPSPPAPPPDQEDHNITIHVRDEARSVSKDFICPKNLLVSEMAYFRHYLVGSTASDDIDISVHCDVQIFEWLMRYMKKIEPIPQLGPKTIVSILISSEFLKMNALVEESIEYFTLHIREIILVPIDLTCISTPILQRIAEKVTIEGLDSLEDPKDKILSSLYKHKLEQIFSIQGNCISMCACCGSLFTSAQHDTHACSKAKLLIDFNGKIVTKHTTDPQLLWDHTACLTALRAESVTWGDIFWKFWGIITDMQCSKCGNRFKISDFGHCTFHPCEPLFLDKSYRGRYQCCKVSILRFDTLERPSGCRAGNHVVDSDNRDRHKLEILLKRRSVILTPYPNDGEFPKLSRLGLPIQSNIPSKLATRTQIFRDAPLQSATPVHKVHQYSIQTVAVASEIDHDDDALDMTVALSDNSSDDGEMDDDDPLLGPVSDESDSDDTVGADGAPRPASSMMKRTTIAFNNTGIRRVVKRTRRTPVPTKSKQSINPAKHRLWKQDSLRDDDRQRMQSLVHRLKDMRKDDNEGLPATHAAVAATAGTITPVTTTMPKSSGKVKHGNKAR